MRVDFKDRGPDWEVDFMRREIGFHLDLHERPLHYCVPLKDGADTLQNLIFAMAKACRVVGRAKCLQCSEIVDRPTGALHYCGGALCPVETP